MNLLKSFKIDKEQIRINATKTDKNRQKPTKIVQNLTQYFLKSATPSKIDNNLTANWQKPTNIVKNGLETPIFMIAFKNSYKYTFPFLASFSWGDGQVYFIYAWKRLCSSITDSIWAQLILLSIFWRLRGASILMKT